MSRTSFDGSATPSGQPWGRRRCGSPAAVAAAADSSCPGTRTTEHPSEHTNRNTSIVASIKGRARMGLQVRIFRRIRILRFEERRVGDGAAVEGLLRRLLVAGRGVEVAVGDELVEVEFEER